MSQPRKYLIYKVTGGLNHMLNQINNMVHLSKVTNRFLIIDCKAGAFKNDFTKYFNIPNFEYAIDYDILYKDQSLNPIEFEPYIKARARSVAKCTYFLNDKQVSIYPNDVLANADQILYLTGVGTIDTPWYIQVNRSIVDQITNRKITDEYIGIHFRNTDMKNEITDFIIAIENLPDHFKTIYFATDDHTATDKLKASISEKFKIVQYTIPPNTHGTNIHYGNPNKDEVIMNALTDMYHLMKATIFIPSSNSSFSRRILELRKTDNFFTN